MDGRRSSLIIFVRRRFSSKIIFCTKRPCFRCASCEIKSYRNFPHSLNIKYFHFSFGCLLAHSLSVYRLMISENTIFASFKIMSAKDAHLRFRDGFIKRDKGRMGFAFKHGVLKLAAKNYARYSWSGVIKFVLSGNMAWLLRKLHFHIRWATALIYC